MNKTRHSIKKIMINRTPPVAIRRFLRQEVGFGCPFCGSPHLEYHHFDPTFAEKPHHNPEGMIAICPTHHAQADGLSKDQIRKLKKNPDKDLKSRFNWRRKHTVFVCGGNYAYNCNAMLRIDDYDIIYFRKDRNGFDTLSLNIYDQNLDTVFEMRDNDWISRSNVDDLDAPPKANRLKMISKIHGVKIDIGFKDRQILNEIEISKAVEFKIPDDENVVFCYLNGQLKAPFPIKFTPGGIYLQDTKMSKNTIADCGVGITII